MLRKVLIVAGALALLVAIIFYTRWRWDECRQVGHGLMYCVLDAGR